MVDIVSAISGLADIWGKSASIDSANQANQIAKENYDRNAQISKKNLEFQKQQFDYQKALNAQQMAREDTAYSRKVADLRAAGLNPALALSGGGMSTSPLRAGEAPQQQAVERKYTPVDYRYPVGEAMERMFLLRAQEANISKTRSEQALLDARTINEALSGSKLVADTNLTNWIYKISKDRGALPTDPLPLKMIDKSSGILQKISDFVDQRYKEGQRKEIQENNERNSRSYQFWKNEQSSINARMEGW